MDLTQLLANLMNDWPLMGVLLVVLIGVYRLLVRILDIASAHFEKATKALEAIADEIQRKSTERGS